MAGPIVSQLKDAAQVEHLRAHKKAALDCAAPVPVELSVIVPTFNERDNVPLLVERLRKVLAGIAWEVIFVDDNSSDGTAQVVLDEAAHNPRVRRILRIGRRGLSGATVEGMLGSTATYVAVMDGDLQHDETLLPRMLKALRAGDADLVVGSRYVKGGSAESFGRGRLAISQVSGAIARRLLKVDLADPMSGFFMMRQDRLQALAPRLSAQGFKILLDIAATARGSLRVLELPYTFGTRLRGESKLSSIVALDFLGLLVAKLSGDLIPVRFFLFSLVGGLGVGAHLAALYVGLKTFSMPFSSAQGFATLVAMTSNFMLNNRLTYRDQRLKGAAFVRGLMGFYLICGVGFLANVGVASWLYGLKQTWWVAGITGAVMGTIWNYAMSSAIVWKAK